MNPANTSSPLATVASLVAAISRGDIEDAVSLYAPNAQFFPEPTIVACGREQIRAALAGLIALRPQLVTETERVIVSGDTALYLSRWNLTGTAPDGSSVRLGGQSSDVLRQQSDGSWLIAIDSPFGAAVLGAG